jgi:hypothetical protein
MKFSSGSSGASVGFIGEDEHIGELFFMPTEKKTVLQ